MVGTLVAAQSPQVPCGSRGAAHSPPEAIACSSSSGGGETFHQCLTPASVSHDMWSLGCVMFHVVSGRPLLPTDAAGRLCSKDLRALKEWTMQDAANASSIAAAGVSTHRAGDDSEADSAGEGEAGERAAACKDLVHWLLHPHPLLRPTSMAEVLEHSFFADDPASGTLRSR